MSKKSTGKSNGSNKNESDTGTTATATAPQNPPATAPVQPSTVPTPAVMNGTPPPAPVILNGTRIENGRIILPDMLPDEAAEFERRRQENEAFAAAIKARKEKQIAELNELFAKVPLSVGLTLADGSPDHETFATMYAAHRNGTLGLDAPAGNLVKQSHTVPEAIKQAVEKDLRATPPVPNVVIATRYNVSLPWVSNYKKSLGLTKPRNRKK